LPTYPARAQHCASFTKEQDMTIQSIMVATDLSVRENVVVRRALHFAIAHDAAVTLKYMPPAGKAPTADARARLSRLAQQLEEVLGLRVACAAVKPHKVEDLCVAACGLDLLVLPHRRERSTAAFFRGQPLLRVLRTARCPMLVTRGSQHADYQRMLVAADDGEASDALVQLATDMNAHAELQLFQASGRAGQASLRAADPGREIVVQQERSGADLVVIGQRRSSAWEDFFCGSVVHRVLSWGRSDVLVVPLGLVPATATSAAQPVPGSRAAGPRAA
jgi:nucleotide-binding universal stress UspA family protein